VELCKELAQRGFIAVAPDTFGGQTTGFVPRAISLVLPAVVQGRWDPHLRAVDSAVDFALEDAKREGGGGQEQVAICGFCFGGGVAVRYGQMRPQRVRACGVFYGKPISEGAEELPPVFAVFGGKDSQFPPQMVDDFELLLRTSDVPCQFKRYPAMGHAFVRDVAAVREEGSEAKDAWEGWLSFCRQF